MEEKHALTCRAALPTYSIGMRVLHTAAHTSSQHTHSVLMGTCGQQTQAMVSGATFLTALLSLGGIQLSLASIYGCCYYFSCCWRKGKFNWLIFFFPPLVLRHRSADHSFSVQIAQRDVWSHGKTWKHFGIAAFYLTCGSLRGAFFGQSPPHRVSGALLWPCGASPGSTFRLAFTHQTVVFFILFYFFNHLKL